MTQRENGPAFYFPSIEKKHGQPISYWLDLIQASQITGHKALVNWLKADYGLGHGHANALVAYALAEHRLVSGEPDPSPARSPAGQANP